GNLPFSSPVRGIAYVYPNSAWNTVGLRLDTGDWLQFLHSSEASVQAGQLVEAGTVIGKTGAIGAPTIQLHVQARSSDGSYQNPEVVIDRAQQAAQVTERNQC